MEAEGLLLGAEYEIDSAAVPRLASDSTCSAYDREFIALAIQLNTKLVTRDRTLLRAFPPLSSAAELVLQRASPNCEPPSQSRIVPVM